MRSAGHVHTACQNPGKEKQKEQVQEEPPEQPGLHDTPAGEVGGFRVVDQVPRPRVRVRANTQVTNARHGMATNGQTGQGQGASENGISVWLCRTKANAEPTYTNNPPQTTGTKAGYSKSRCRLPLSSVPDCCCSSIRSCNFCFTAVRHSGARSNSVPRARLATI
jgi:hypothetical protein